MISVLPRKRKTMLDSMVRWYPKNIFYYLRSMLQKDEDIDENVSHRIKVS
jgi:hypothetical protein